MTPDRVTQALLALQKGNFSEARDHIRSHTSVHPPEAQHYLIEGLASLALADWPAAGDIFEKATDAFPNNAQFWFNRGLAEENLDKLTEAEASYQKSLSLKPEQGEAFGNLSNVYRKLGHFPEAVQMACRALAAGVPKAHALNVLGLALAKQGNFTEAARAYDEAITIAPHEAAIKANRANLAVDQLKFDEAWPYFAEARALDDLPIIRRDEGMARMLAGDYVTGLPLYEARLELPKALRVHPSCPRWKNESLRGKTLLLLSEQGFGDTIQFSQHASQLVEMGANLVWMVRQPLQRLFAANLPGKVILESDPVPLADYWLPILSLPFALGMTAEAAPAIKFSAPKEPKLPPTSKPRKIGLVWCGSRGHGNDHERSIQLLRLAPLWERLDAEFYAPFKGGAENLAGHATPVIALDHLIHDFADAAALMAQMDCIVTVGTASVHLAGALEIPTYYLMPYCLDWRWRTKGESTAWYPRNMTILRQPSYGDWDSVIRRLVERLD